MAHRLVRSLVQVSAHLHLLPPCALLTHSSRTPYSLLTARSLPLTPYPSPLPLLLQPPSRAETSLQAAAEPAVGAAQTLRVLSARVLPPQPLQLQLRVGGWLGRELATVRRRRCRPQH